MYLMLVPVFIALVVVVVLSSPDYYAIVIYPCCLSLSLLIVFPFLSV